MQVAPKSPTQQRGGVVKVIIQEIPVGVLQEQDVFSIKKTCGAYKGHKQQPSKCVAVSNFVYRPLWQNELPFTAG
jgi:hypothetical protein